MTCSVCAGALTYNRRTSTYRHRKHGVDHAPIPATSADGDIRGDLSSGAHPVSAGRLNAGSRSG